MTAADWDWDDGDGGRDPGLARERTELAWNRSGLAVAVVVAILFRRLWPLHGVRTAIALGLGAAGAATWAVGMRLSRRPVAGEETAGPLGEHTLRLVTAGTVLLAAAGAVVGVVLPS